MAHILLYRPVTMKSLPSSLMTLHQSGLIRPAAGVDSPEYLIRHSLIRDTAYRSILYSERKDIHLVVGDVLRRHFPEQEVADVLAQHYEKAEHSELAFKYHLMAADAAYDQYANFEAVEHYERAFRYMDPDKLDRNELIRIHRYFGRALELVGEFRRTIEVLDKLIELAKEREDPRLKLLPMIGQARLMATVTPVHDPDSAEVLATRALRLARDLGERAEEVRAQWVLLLRELYRNEDLDEAERRGLEAMEKARQLGDERLLALILTDVARLYQTKSEPKKSLRFAEEGYELWQRDGNLVMQADIGTLMGASALVTGELARATASFEEALQMSRETDNPWGASIVLANASMVDHMQGRSGEALDKLRQAREISAQATMPAAQLAVDYFTVWVYLDLGALEQGIQLCRKVLEWAQEMTPAHRSLMIALQARLELQRGDIIQSRELVSKAEGMQDEAAAFGWLWNPLALARIELASASGDHQTAVNVCQEVSAYLEDRGLSLFLPEVLCHLGSESIAVGEPESALGALKRAQHVAEDMAVRRDAWRILVERARVEEKLGMSATAKKHRDAARREAVQVAEGITDPALARSFLERPLVAQLLDREDPGSQVGDR